MMQPMSAVIQSTDMQNTILANSMRKRAANARQKQPQIFECDLFGCNNVFKTKYSLQRHYKKHYS